MASSPACASVGSACDGPRAVVGCDGVIVAGVVLVVVVAALAVLGSSLFAVDEVEVTGNVYTDAAELQAVVDDLTGTPVLLVDTLAAEEQLESIPWVEDARVTTRFPNSATIEIRERTPLVAMPGADGQSRVLDREGRVLATGRRATGGARVDQRTGHARHAAR